MYCGNRRCMVAAGLKRVATIAGAACLLYGNALAKYENCTGSVSRAQNAECDTTNNVAECLYDGGDCCPSTCVSTDETACTTNTRQCIDPEATDFEYKGYENCGGTLTYIRDGVCDNYNNILECGYDGGDCCPSTCIQALANFCPEDTDDCIDPDAEDYSYKDYANCTGVMPLGGDGRCDEQNNQEACGYDMGDCCECTCVPGRFSCVGDFNCLDPEALLLNTSECTTYASQQCSLDVPRQWVVNDTAGATDLARGINCSGGVFDVLWEGHVIVRETIWINDLTVLNITGSGSSQAIADGDGSSRILGVENATLHVRNLQLMRGSATAGGALFVTSGTVSFEGSTGFLNNTADDHGGAIFMGAISNVTFDGNTTFANNSGTWHGGAVHIRENSTLRWAGNTTFSGNEIESIGPELGQSYGGAIYALLGSRIEGSGLTTFESNSVRASDAVDRIVYCYGGALALDSKSSALLSDEIVFENNWACFCGGAVHVNGSESTMSWSAVTYFATNVANNGGAMCLDEGGQAMWDTSTHFIGNNATENGGAIHADSKSSISWTNHTIFTGNNAQDGGGSIYVGEQSQVEWTGEATFDENGASDGGAVYVGVMATLAWTGRADFSSNSARFQGGAIAAALDGMTGEDAIISIDGPTTFRNNTAGNYAGAIIVSGAVELSVGSEDVIFVENVAGSAGGALLITGVAFGPTFRGIQFVSNHAQIGGAVYSTGTGSALSTVEGGYPLTYESCTFTSNSATATGGAVESAAGRDSFVTTSFVGNMARRGGALLLAGLASLENCSFEDNSADEEGGPAITNVGLTHDINACWFSGNFLRCWEGAFLSYEEGNRYEVVCSGCEECVDCSTVDNDTSPICEDALEHTQSSGIGVVLETLVVDAGYWRATPSSRDVLDCHNSDACLGGVTGATNYCATGYEGPYCAVCSENYTESLSFTCSACSERKVIVVAGVIVPLVVIIAITFLAYMVSKENKHSSAGCFSRLRRLLPLQSLKIVIVATQILMELTSVASISFPTLYEVYLDRAHVLNFDLGWIMSAGCFVDIDFHDRVITSTVAPAVLMGIVVVTYKLASRRNRHSQQAIQEVRKKHVSIALWITFLVYSSVSTVLFKMFSCEELDDGKTYLRADYRIDCDSTKHRHLQVYSGLMIFVYPLGIPVVYATILFVGRDARQIAAGQKKDTARVHAASQLSSPYRPGCFYYEIVECFRRVTMTGVIVFDFRHEMDQVAVSLVMAILFALSAEALAPYSSPWDTWISRTGHIIVIFSVFVAFLLDVEGDAQSEDLYGGVLVAANACLIVAVLVEGVTMAYSVARTAEALPRSISSAAVSFAGEEEAPGDHMTSRANSNAFEAFPGIARRDDNFERARSSLRVRPEGIAVRDTWGAS